MSRSPRCYSGASGESYRGSHEGEPHRGAGEGHRSAGQRTTRHDRKPARRGQKEEDKDECSKRLNHSRALLKALRRRSTLVKRLCAKEVRSCVK